MEPVALIKLENLGHNIKYLKKMSNNSSVMPVIKANAYGHGSIKIAKYLSRLDNYIFCVATESEILELANTDINNSKILHLGKLSSQFNTFHLKNVIYTINHEEDIDILEDKSRKFNNRITCHIKIDTGMNRMGLEYKNYKGVLDIAFKSKYLNISSIYSHLSCSNSKDSDYNSLQINRFKNIIKYSNQNNYHCSFHLLSSSGLYNFSKNCFDAQRLGLSIYGICPIDRIDENLKSVLELRAPVKLIKDVSKGEVVGYGATFVAEDDMKIAIVQCGYADGIPLIFSNSGKVKFKNNYYPIVGRISMDLTCIKVDNKVKLNDVVTIWGGNDREMKIETIAKKYNLLPYVLLTGISQRVKRIYE